MANAHLGRQDSVKRFGSGRRDGSRKWHFASHRHAPPEFYFCLSGSGVVTMDGQPHQIAPGAAVFIPANVEHAVRAGADGLKFAYGFGENAFSEIVYQFSA